jgi:hypothetical protein
MKQLHSEIEIEAPPERVWAVLVDLAGYPEWNPFIVAAAGRVEAGARLRLRMSPPGGRSIALKPRATVVVEGEALEWLGRIAIPGLFAGRHRFELHRTATGTRLVQSETFTGLLVPLLARSLDAHTLPGFVAMNDALKARAEQVAADAC